MKMAVFLKPVCVAFFFCFISQSFAEEPIQKEIAELKAFVDSGLKHVKEHGEKKAYQEFNNPKGKFRKGDLYLFVIGFDGKVFAEGGDPKAFVGKNLFNAKDDFGTPYFQLWVDAARRGGGLVSYYWPRPHTGVSQYKTSYIVPLNEEVFIGTGSYQPIEMVESQETKVKKLKQFVDSAVEYVKKRGVKEAYKEFNNRKGAFVRADRYIFVARYDGLSLAHGGDPETQVGINISNLTDEFGTPIFKLFVQAAKNGGGAIGGVLAQLCQFE